MRFFWGVFSGGVAALDHRLIAAMPPACDPSLSMILSLKGFHNPRHSRGSFHRVFFTPQKYGVLLTHQK
jgi:hypothetical protein